MTQSSNFQFEDKFPLSRSCNLMKILCFDMAQLQDEMLKH